MGIVLRCSYNIIYIIEYNIYTGDEMYTFFIGFIFYYYCVVSCEGVRIIIYNISSFPKQIDDK